MLKLCSWFSSSVWILFNSIMFMLPVYYKTWFPFSYFFWCLKCTLCVWTSCFWKHRFIKETILLLLVILLRLNQKVLPRRDSRHNIFSACKIKLQTPLPPKKKYITALPPPPLPCYITIRIDPQVSIFVMYYIYQVK